MVVFINRCRYNGTMLEFRRGVKPATRGDNTHMSTVRRILKMNEFKSEVELALKEGSIYFSLKDGFSGRGFEALHPAIRSVLTDNLLSTYGKLYGQYTSKLAEHEELGNYSKVRKGALIGIGAGVTAGVAIDGITTHYDYHGVWGEISARSTPALLEAAGIAQPFFKRGKEFLNWKFRGIGERPESFTSTELWALTQLLGPIVGFVMLVIGEATGLNQHPGYKATAVFTVNTGNNVIGSASCLYQQFREVREIRDKSPKETPLLKRIRNFFDDLYLAACNLMRDKFQSSNILVAGAWYGGELGLRSVGIAAENVSFESGFGGNTLAAVESGALSCDTAAAAGLAILMEKRELRKEIDALS